jgi:hypothetical protein
MEHCDIRLLTLTHERDDFLVESRPCNLFLFSEVFGSVRILPTELILRHERQCVVRPVDDSPVPRRRASPRNGDYTISGDGVMPAKPAHKRNPVKQLEPDLAEPWPEQNRATVAGELLEMPLDQ